MSTALQAGLDRPHDQYPEFLAALRYRFAESVVAAGAPLFTTNASGLFETFLKCLPPQARQHYTCHACWDFVNRYGGLVTITTVGHALSALWCDVPPFFIPAITALRQQMAKAQVNGVFISSDDVWGRPVTGEWQHMAVTPPASMVWRSKTKTAYQRRAELQEDFQNLLAGLREFPVAAVDQALVLLQTESLYRSEKCLGVAEWLKDLHTRRAATKNAALQRNLTWRAVATAPAGFCHVRSTMIGTLLADLVAGLSFSEVSRRFAAKMHPLQYQRPQAPPSAGNIAQAEKVMQQLQTAGALERRFARLEELETIWKPAERCEEPSAGGGVFAHLIPKSTRTAVPPLNVPPQVMTWAKFAHTVLPTAEAMEFYVAPRPDDYSALVTAVHSDAPHILQWNNPFSWYVYYNGSPPAQWNLTTGFCPVTAVCFQPSMWGETHVGHQGKSIIFILAGAKDTGYQHAGNALFPETLKSEFHGIRATIEAYSRQAVLGGYEEASACGIRLQAGKPWTATFRVTAGGTTVLYQLDRWDQLRRMPMIFHALTATGYPDLDDGQFSPEALQQLADTSAGVPLTLHFETVIGRITSAENTPQGVVVWGEIDAPYALFDLARCFVVPGFQCREKTRADDGDHFVGLRAALYAITGRPSDTHLTHMEEEHA